MGTWGPHSFDNDDASDFLSELEAFEQPYEAAERVREALDVSATAADADAGAMAIAAAEVVAAALGRPAAGAQTAPMDLSASFKFYDDTAALALDAVQSVRSPGSELAELWADADAPDTWTASLADLEARLRGAVADHGLPNVPHPAEADAAPAKHRGLAAPLAGLDSADAMPTSAWLILWASPIFDAIEAAIAGLPHWDDPEIDYGDAALDGPPAYLKQATVRIPMYEAALDLPASDVSALDIHDMSADGMERARAWLKTVLRPIEARLLSLGAEVPA